MINFVKSMVGKSYTQKLRKQADKKNSDDLKKILSELDNSSKEGEYTRIVQLKVNQVFYLESLGLQVDKTERIGYYKISWK